MTGAAAGRVTVVGGGIAGLSAAFDLHRAGVAVTVLEASDRWGGKIHSSPVGDRPVDAGPDAFLARAPSGRDLCVDLGLEDELTSPVAPVPAYIHHRDELHEMPRGTMLGVPTDLIDLARSGLISAKGIARAEADLTMGPSTLDPDPSVGEVCRARLGDEVTDLLIDPLIGAINASDIDRLSLDAAAPQLAGAIRGHGSLITGMTAFQQHHAALGTRDPDRPVFYGLPGGIARIIDRLVEELADADLRLGHPVTRLADLPPSDAIIAACPAFAAADLLGLAADDGGDPAAAAVAADQLRSIHYADVSQVMVEIPLAGLDPVLDASGILFPRSGGTVMTACTWLSTKWDHYRRPTTALIRISAGRFGDDRHGRLTDRELADTVLAELGTVIEMTAAPVATRITRWRQAFPQYTPGHRTRVAQARAAATAIDPRLHLIGASYDGIGIPACIDAGRSVAATLVNA
ncbi:MAG: protoporphyrinogen oxidase [Actinomycetota bacterium]